MTLPGFSVVTPNRNRLASLREVIGSWQSCAHVTDIVVVDLGSREPIAPAHFLSRDKLHIVRVTNVDTWRIGLAINIGVDHAASALICKLDSDITLQDGGFLARLELRDGFYRGRDRSAVSNGQVCFAKEACSRVGGYHEWLSGYGFDDSDFYQRLRSTGLAERPLPDNSLTEISTPFEARAATECQTGMLSVNLTDPGARMTYMQSRNTYLAMLRRWSGNLRIRYDSRRGSDGVTTVELGDWSDEYRWADALANYLAVVRLSGTPDNVSLLNSLVRRYLESVGGF